jgi:hypothetical protein
MNIATTGNCATLELVDISTEPTPEAMIRVVSKSGFFLPSFHKKKPYVTFAGVIARETGDHASNRTDDYAQSLADYIGAEGLGEVVKAAPARRNWTGNIMQPWMWMPDYHGLEAWRQRNPEPAQPTYLQPKPSGYYDFTVDEFAPFNDDPWLQPRGRR